MFRPRLTRRCSGLTSFAAELHFVRRQRAPFRSMLHTGYNCFRVGVAVLGIFVLSACQEATVRREPTDVGVWEALLTREAGSHPSGQCVVSFADESNQPYAAVSEGLRRSLAPRAAIQWYPSCSSGTPLLFIGPIALLDRDNIEITVRRLIDGCYVGSRLQFSRSQDGGSSISAWRPCQRRRCRLTRRCSGLATLAAELHFVRPRRLWARI